MMSDFPLTAYAVANVNTCTHYDNENQDEYYNKEQFDPNNEGSNTVSC